MTFNTDYLPVALILLGAAWAVIRWIGRSLVEIAGDAIELEDRRLIEHLKRKPRTAPPATETVADLSQAERQRIYDQLVRDLDAQGATEAERAFALAVAMKRLGLRGGKAAVDLTAKKR